MVTHNCLTNFSKIDGFLIKIVTKYSNEVQYPRVLATILDLATRNSGFLDDQYINSTLGLATYIGFSDLNRVDENWSLNPAGTVFN